MALLYIGIAIVVLIQLALFWMKKKHNYWKDKGVQGPEPAFFFGHVKDMLTLKKHLGEVYSELYFKNKKLPIVGTYAMFRPTLLVNDLELIKKILVKDFNHFTDHSGEIDLTHEPLAEHLFNVGGEKWKKMRVKFTPTFTTSKMKFMFETLKETSVDLDRFLEKVTAKNTDVDIKEILAHFTMNIIGNCAFGVNCNAFENPDSKFIKTSKTLFEPSNFAAIMQLTIFFCMPSVFTHLKFSFLGKEITDFFHDLVKDTIEYRNKNNIERNDFLQILMKLQEHGHVDDSETTSTTGNDDIRLTTMQLAAQCFMFFIAGYETSSTTASFALYELALNPEVQEKLRDNIKSVLKKHDGNISYESIGEMTYLTKVLEETMRKYPTLPVLFRICTKDYTIPNTNILIKKDTPVFVPVAAIQKDPEYFPNPEKFDPERFSPENKESRPQFSYLPFGEGPRICIASRFGMMQMRLGLITILLKYKVSVCDKTQVPIVYDKKKPTISSPDGGLWLKFTKIE